MLASNNGSSTEATGLNCFSPDPCWGRAGKDLYLLSVTSVAYTQDLQEGDDKKYVKIGACAKHYAVRSTEGSLHCQHFNT